MTTFWFIYHVIGVLFPLYHSVKTMVEMKQVTANYVVSTMAICAVGWFVWPLLGVWLVLDHEELRKPDQWWNKPWFK